MSTTPKSKAGTAAPSPVGENVKRVDALEKVGNDAIAGLVGKVVYSPASRKGISQYRLFKYHQKEAKCTVLSDWRYPSVKAD